MKVAVYTSIIGNYDKLRKHKQLDNVDYYFLSDDMKREIPKFYKRVKVTFDEELDNTRKSRYLKILGYNLFKKDYDYSIWVDGNMTIIGDIRNIINKLGDGYIGILNQRGQKGDVNKGCIEHEMQVCLKCSRDKKEIMNKQIQEYFKEGYPKKNGMYESGILVRKHDNKELDTAMLQWWHEVKNKSKRDQLSFGYVMWKFNLKYKLLPNLNEKFTKTLVQFNPSHGR